MYTPKKFDCDFSDYVLRDTWKMKRDFVSFFLNSHLWLMLHSAKKKNQDQCLLTIDTALPIPFLFLSTS
jgi:hypothetical protein